MKRIRRPPCDVVLAKAFRPDKPWPSDSARKASVDTISRGNLVIKSKSHSDAQPDPF